MNALAILWIGALVLGVIIPALLWSLPSMRRWASRKQVRVGQTARLREPPVLYVIDGSLPRSSGGAE